MIKKVEKQGWQHGKKKCDKRENNGETGLEGEREKLAQTFILKHSLVSFFYKIKIIFFS